MKNIIALTLIASIFLPLLANAYTLQVSAQSSANSGGAVSQNGQTVVTPGADAVAEVNTTITANGSGGTATVEIVKTENGQTHRSVQQLNIPSQSTVQIQAGTTSVTPRRATTENDRRAPETPTSVSPTTVSVQQNAASDTNATSGTTTSLLHVDNVSLSPAASSTILAALSRTISSVFQSLFMTLSQLL